jgi:hypothetical protein
VRTPAGARSGSSASCASSASMCRPRSSGTSCALPVFRRRRNVTVSPGARSSVSRPRRCSHATSSPSTPFCCGGCTSSYSFASGAAGSSTSRAPPNPDGAWMLQQARNLSIDLDDRDRAAALPDPRPGHQVRPRVRRTLPRRGNTRYPNPGPGAERKRAHRTLGRQHPPRMSRQAVTARRLCSGRHPPTRPPRRDHPRIRGRSRVTELMHPTPCLSAFRETVSLPALGTRPCRLLRVASVRLDLLGRCHQLTYRHTAGRRLGAAECGQCGITHARVVQIDNVDLGGFNSAKQTQSPRGAGFRRPPGCAPAAGLLVYDSERPASGCDMGRPCTTRCLDVRRLGDRRLQAAVASTSVASSW